MGKTVQLLAVILVGFLLFGCAQFEEKRSEMNNGDGERITIGAIYNLTGAQSNLDIPSAAGARAAVLDINKRGGILGKQLHLIVKNGESQPQIIASKMAKLFDQEPSLVGVIGLSDTDMVLAAAPVAAAHKRVFITSGATSPQLPQEVPDYLFLACFGDNVQAAVGAEWAYNSLGARKVMILYNSTSTYTRLLQKYFHRRFTELGGRIVLAQPYDPEKLDSFPDQIEEADLIYLAATPEEVLPILSKLRKQGVAAPVLGGDGLDIGRGWQLGAEFRDVYFTTHAYLGSNNHNPQVKAFRKKIAVISSSIEQDAFAALGFDTINLLVAAIDEAGTTQPEDIRRALSETTAFSGITGEISYRDSSRIPAKSVTIIKVVEGEQQLVGEFLPEKVPVP